MMISYSRKVCASCNVGVMRRKSSTSLIKHLQGRQKNKWRDGNQAGVTVKQDCLLLLQMCYYMTSRTRTLCFQ